MSEKPFGSIGEVVQQIKQNRNVSVGIVTVTYNSEPVLAEFLESLSIQSLADIHLYAIDNASHDASVKMLHDFRSGSGIGVDVVLNAQNVGVALANNQGIELARKDACEWIFLLNNDTRFDANFVGDLLSEAIEHGLDLVSPVIEATSPPATIWYSGGEIYPWQAMAVRHRGVGMSVSVMPTQLCRTGYASTCALLVRAKVFDAVGIMEPTYFVYFDDVDFAIRATRAGFQYWVTPRSRMIHKASSLTGGKQSTFTIHWTSRNWVLLVRRNLKGARLVYSLAYIQAWALGRLLLRRDTIRVYRARIRGHREGMLLTALNDSVPV